MCRYVFYSLMVIVCFDEATANSECASSLVSETDKSPTTNTIWDAVAVFQINGEMVDCYIDVMKIYIDLTKRLRKNEISMQLQLICWTSSRIHFTNGSDVLQNFNGNVTVYLDIDSCSVDLDELSLFNHLGRIYSLSLLNISSISIGSNCSILKGLQSIDFSPNCANTSTNNFDEKLFFWEKCEGNFDSLSALKLTGCQTYNANYLTLKTKFPYIRVLKLSSIKLQTTFVFPWTSLQTESDMDYPLMIYKERRRTWIFSLNDIDIFPKAFVTFKGRIDDIIINNLSISTFERDIFWNVTGMTRLDLSQNKLIDIQPDLLRCQTSLKYLRLSGNKLKHLDSTVFQFLRNLTYLDLSYNLITDIDGNLFSSLHVLKEIHLEHNFINSIPKDFLQEQVSTIQNVFLQFNNIKTIPVFPLYAKHLQIMDLNHCNVDGNSFTTLLNHFNLLEVTDGYLEVSSEYTNIHKSESFSRRAVLDLSYCNITDVSTDRINNSGLMALKVLSNMIEFRVFGNPFDCSCSQWAPVFNINWTCLNPLDLRGRPLKSITLEEMRCPFPSTECPKNCKCYRRRTSKNIIIDCNNINVTTFPLEVPNGNIELWFQNSSITHITPREYFKNILALDISYNKVYKLSPSVILSFPRNIKSVLLNNNHFTSLPVQLKSLNVSKLALSHNPFICDCHTKWMKDWLLNRTTPVIDWNQVKCTYNSSRVKQLISVPSYMFVCPQLNSSTFSVAEHVIFPAIVIGCILFVLITLSLTVYFQRFTVKVLLYMYTGLRPFDNLPGDESSFLYDAFVIYTERKIQMAHEKLLDSLTARGYRVADLSRNFIIGLSLVDNLERLIHKSKRIIFYVSGDFTEDDLIMAGWNIAYQRAISGDFNSIIFIASRDFRKQCKEDSIRKFKRTKAFIKDDSKLLINKVVYLMPKLLESPYMETDNINRIFEDNENGINYVMYPTEDDILSKEVNDKLIPFLRENHQNVEHFGNAFVAGTDMRNEIDVVLDRSKHFIYILSPEMLKEERYEVSLFILSTVISKSKLTDYNYLLVITTGELRNLDMPGDLRSYLDKYKTCNYNDPALKQFLLDSLVYCKQNDCLAEEIENPIGREADTRILLV